jgi:uncharacterized protein YlxP (DUF503 family)
VIIAAAKLGLYMPYSHSLKEKRSVLRKIKDKAKAVHDVRIADVGDQDTWQSAELGFALVGINRATLETRMNDVIRFVEEMGVGEVTADDRELIYFGDES